MDIKFRIDKDTSFAFYIDYGDEPLTPLQQWGKFVNEYTTQFVPIKQHINQIINDPDATETEKANARQDLTIQGRCLQIVNDKYEEIQQTGVVPTSWTIDAQTVGSGVYKWSDNNNYSVTLGYPLGGAITDSFTFADAEHFKIVLTYTYPTSGRNNHLESMTAHFPPSTQDGNFGLQPSTGGTWTGNFSWTAQDVKGNLTSKTKNFSWDSGYTPQPCIGVGLSVPTISAGRTVGVGTWNGEIVSYNICGNFISVAIPGGTVTDPWDYYNNYILPQVTTTTNAVFPNGYTP